MDTFSQIADERRGLADLLSGLTSEQLSTPSLCDAWSVHDVAAHLVMPMEVSTSKFLLAMLVSRGNFDRANVRLTRQIARRPIGDLVEVLRLEAENRFTPPGAGPEAPLTDLLVHGLDIRWPLGLTREIPPERLRTSLTFVTSGAGRGFVAKGTLQGLRFEAEDLDWTHGSGSSVTGGADALLLTLTGRGAAVGRLGGTGLSTLQARLSPPPAT